jgi:hypothetical protein
MVAARPHTAAAVDHHPFPGAHLAQRNDGAKGGDETATQAGRLDELQRVRESDEIAVGMTERDAFGK